MIALVRGCALGQSTHLASAVFVAVNGFNYSYLPCAA